MIQEFNRLMIEQELLSHIIDNTINPQSDQDLKNKIINYLISILTNEKLPENFKIDTLIEHNITHPSKLLENYLKSLPEMTDDVLKGNAPPDMITQKHHGYMSMVMMAYDSSNIKIVNSSSIVKNDKYAFTIELNVHKNTMLIYVLEQKTVINLQNFQYIKAYINNYEDLKDVQGEHLNELIEQLII